MANSHHRNKYCNRKCYLNVIGFSLILVGTVFALLWDQLFYDLLSHALKMEPNSRVFSEWKSPSVPLNADYYFFNWTNPENFTEGEYFVKPILKECGPYRFKEVLDKDDIEWHSQNSTVTYKKKSTFYFDPAGHGKLSDKLTTLNIVALGAANKVKDASYLKQKTVSIALNMYEEKLMITKTAGELLFEGYQDDMIDVAREMPSSFLAENDDTPVPERFGWFYDRNGTSKVSGQYNMHTGQNDISQLGVMKNWNYNSRTNFFPGRCGMIDGSSGEFYPPNQQRDRPITFYTPELCRSITFNYVEDVEINGILGYKYSGGSRVVDNGTLYPDNKCFTGTEIYPSGVMDLSSCRYGTPLYMSFPHYYAADNYFIEQVTGLNPNREQHEFYVVLEPKTGVILEVAARLQINILLRTIENIAIYEHIRKTFFPIMWLEQKVQIPIKDAEDLKILIIIPTIAYIISGLVILSGFILIAWNFVAEKLFKKRKQPKDIDSTGLNHNTDGGLFPEGYPLVPQNEYFQTVNIKDSNDKS